MPTRTAVRVEIRRPRSCVSCIRHDGGRARPHSAVRFHTRTGAAAGETTVWRPIAEWIADQAARGWDVIAHDTDTGEAYLEHRDGRTAHVAARTSQ